MNQATYGEELDQFASSLSDQRQRQHVPSEAHWFEVLPRQSLSLSLPRAVRACFKPQNTHKHHITNKREIRNSNVSNSFFRSSARTLWTGFWTLGFGWDVGFEIWDFRLPD
jgi:hypothetical protein